MKSCIKIKTALRCSAANVTKDWDNLSDPAFPHLDICGFKKPQLFYRDVVWRRSQIEMAVHAPVPAGLTEVLGGWAWPDESRSWNWRGYEGTPLQVSVDSRCEKVRLELNGKVMGEITLRAEAVGLDPAAVTIQTR